MIYIKDVRCAPYLIKYGNSSSLQTNVSLILFPCLLGLLHLLSLASRLNDVRNHVLLLLTVLELSRRTLT